jgi:hypothetical protein
MAGLLKAGVSQMLSTAIFLYPYPSTMTRAEDRQAAFSLGVNCQPSYFLSCVRQQHIIHGLASACASHGLHMNMLLSLGTSQCLATEYALLCLSHLSFSSPDIIRPHATKPR